LFSVASLLLCACLLLSPRFGNARRFTLETPLGDFGPFDNSLEVYVGILTIAAAVPPVLWIMLKIRRDLRRSRPPRGFDVLSPPPDDDNVGIPDR
jgi:hypothetical protein